MTVDVKRDKGVVGLNVCFNGYSLVLFLIFAYRPWNNQISVLVGKRLHETEQKIPRSLKAEQCTNSMCLNRTLK